MERFLGNFTPYAYALLRIVSGLMFACHGGQHVLGMFGKAAAPTGSFFWVGGLIELVCGFLVGFGLFGGYAAFLCSGTMAVAYFMAHFPKSPLPILNGGDPAVLYCFIFLFIACRGSGVLSIDQAIHRAGPVVDRERL